MSQPAFPSPSQLILASASARRQQLLLQAGYQVIVRPIQLPEPVPEASETPLAYLDRVVRWKFDRATEDLQSYGDENLPLLVADTIVVLNENVLGKPRNLSEARQYLERLSGKIHTVHTSCMLGMSLGERWMYEAWVDTANVRFPVFNEDQIERFLDDDVTDRAGGYSIQGEIGTIATLESGDVETVMGLCTTSVINELQRLVAKVKIARGNDCA